MDKSNDRIREFRQGDETGISVLFKDVFKTDKTVEYIRWQYMDHPGGPGWLYLSSIDDAIVGECCTMRSHLNFLGKEIPAGELCDGLIRQDQRGKGLFTGMVERNCERAIEEGFKAIIGFPNRSAYPVYIKKLDWYNITYLDEYSFKTGYRKLTGAVLDKIVKIILAVPVRIRFRVLKDIYHSFLHHNDVKFITTSKLPDDIKEVLEEALKNEVISVWKDLPYLRWRYEDHPENDYEFHIMIVDGEPVGVTICRKMNDIVAICDLIHKSKNIDQSELMLLYALSHYFSTGAQKIEFFGHDNGFFETVFRRCRFKRISPSKFVLVGKVFDDRKLESLFGLPHNWKVTYGDTDII
ncbi:MAG: GNAT family N-acetyltransferase [Candidatus Krumholzibacteriota bacterium]|nr:GNAT family N-acetyltransferase [Candidatus Krumholzibacteriota bacterium]